MLNYLSGGLPLANVLHVQLLGNFHLVYDGKPVAGLDSPRLQSFLAYLIIHHETPLSREQLSYLFWPDSNESQSRTNLRNMLYRLREALPDADDFLQIETQTLWWKPEGFLNLDLDIFHEAVNHTDQTGSGTDQEAHCEALIKVVEAYGGDLLPSCYDDWIFPERERLKQDFIRILEELIEILELDQKFDLAIRYTQQLLRQDPLHENSYRRLMELYARNGEKARALRAYHTCTSTLEKELGIDPSPVTRRLYEEIMDRDIELEKPARVSEKASRLVGRKTAWLSLQKSWKELDLGAHLVLILGEAGIGKTYLAEEFTRWARRGGIQTLISHSYPTEGELAYAPLTTLLRSESIQSNLSILEETWLVELSRLLPELRKKFPQLPDPEQMTESWQRQRLFEASTRALLGGKSRLVLVLDDLQWCDHETLDWLRYLLEYQTKSRLLVIGGVRTEDLTAESPLITLFSDLEQSGKISEILLERLDREATCALAADLWGDPLVNADAERLFLESEGNPLFIAEMVRAGFLGAEAGGWTLPSKVQAIIETRLNALSSPAREIATIAAVVGREFDFDLLIKAGNGQEEQLLQALDELWGRRLIRDEGEGYNFGHDKFREVIYQGLSPHRRKYFHAKIGAALEEINCKNLEKVAPQLASHFSQGGKKEQAAAYFLLAGDQARRLYARRDAIDYYQQAAGLLDDQTDERLVSIYQGWGDVLLKMAQYEETTKAYQKMLAAAESIGDCEGQARAWLAIGKVRDRQGDHSGALDCAEKVLLLPEENDCVIEMAEAVLLKGQSHYRLGEVEQADEFVKNALERCQKGNDHFTTSRCFSLLGLIQDDLGNYPAAREFKEQALEIIKTIEGDWVKEWIGTLYNNLANTANLAGDDQGAIQLYLQALDIFKETKNQDMIIMCQVNMGAARVGLGEYQLAEEDFRSVLELTEGSGWLGLSLTCHFLAEACLSQGKLKDALGAARKALGYAQETGAQQALGAAWRSLGKVASLKPNGVALDGKKLPAADCFQLSDLVFAHLGAEGERAHTLKAWAEHELARGDKKRGEKIWGEAREIFERLEMTAEVEKMDKQKG